MASETKLKFREIWVILSPAGLYAANIITDNTVVTYEENKDDAQRFRTYEEAIIQLKTLDTVIKRGHRLQRFFEPRN